MVRWNIPKVMLSYHWNITELFIRNFSENFDKPFHIIISQGNISAMITKC